MLKNEKISTYAYHKIIIYINLIDLRNLFNQFLHSVRDIIHSILIYNNMHKQI